MLSKVSNHPGFLGLNCVLTERIESQVSLLSAMDNMHGFTVDAALPNLPKLSPSRRTRRQ